MMAPAANKAIVKRMQNTRNAIIYNEKEKKHNGILSRTIYMFISTVMIIFEAFKISRFVS